MIANLITLADFSAYVPFSVNIGAHLVDPHIRQAQTFDVWPLLPAPLRTALTEAVGEYYPDEFDSAEFNAALADLGPATVALLDLIRPLLVLEAAREMLLWHGLHITPAGAEIVVGQPISGQQRTELRANLQAKADHYRAQLEAALRKAYPPAFNTCGAVRRRRGHGGLQSSAI